MGFPRIISKNNKIYTKLGEFCLSGDGNQFWIVCHTCQEELQTQGQFWKHIQDEHNFLHGIKQEQAGVAYMDTSDTAGNIMPLPLYRKVSITDQQQQQRQEANSGGEDEEVQKEAKDYTEMRSHEVDNTATVAIDIKLEPSSLSQSLPASEQVQQQQQQQQQQQHTTTQHNPQQQLDMSAAAPLMYQIPQIHPPVSAYGALVQVPTIKYEIAAVAAAASHHHQQQQQQQHMPTSMAAALMSQDLSKDNMSNNNNNNNTTTNSTTASASSAVSSDDGERWYVCDFENCGLKFKYQSRLELHRSVHSKERRFACEICGASFKQSCNLSTHRKKKHALKGIKSSLVLPQRF